MRDILIDQEFPSLNIGPGYAHLEKILPEGHIKITIDRKLSFLSYLKGIPNQNLINAVAEYLPFRDSSLPTITTQSTFQVMFDQKAFLRELFRVLKPNGLFIITIEFGNSYEISIQQFPIYRYAEDDETGKLLSYIKRVGLHIYVTKCLNLKNEWGDNKVEAFSLWIFGGKKLHIEDIPVDSGFFIDFISWDRIIKRLHAWRIGACPQCYLYPSTTPGHCKVHGKYEDKDYLEIIEEIVSNAVKIKYPMTAFRRVDQKDMKDYLIERCDPIDVESVLDVGCGNKGVIAQHYWQELRRIKRGCALDIFTLKPLPPLWTPIIDDALNLRDHFEPNSVDVISACGFLEHLTPENGVKFLKLAEEVAYKLVYITASTVLRDASKKVERDGNPHHAYRSSWSHEKLTELGYTTNIKDFNTGVWALSPDEIAAWKFLDGYEYERMGDEWA